MKRKASAGSFTLPHGPKAKPGLGRWFASVFHPRPGWYGL